MKRFVKFLLECNPWALLIVSILVEVCGATMMKLSEGFTIVPWLAGTIIAYTISLMLLTFVLKRVPLGVAYGIWGGMGTVLTTVIGIMFWNDPFGAGTVIGIALIVAGITALSASDGGKTQQG